MTDQQILEVIRLRHRLRELSSGHGRQERAVVLDAFRRMGEHLDDAALRSEHQRWEVHLGANDPPAPPDLY